jgi:hypothetical protein
VAQLLLEAQALHQACGGRARAAIRPR